VSMSIRIILADDHKIVCDSLKPLLNGQPNMEIVGVAENGREAVKLVQKLNPDVVIMDITMPGLNGIDATHQIIAKFPETKVIALSIHSDKRFIMEILKAGAFGYLTKTCSVEELINAVQIVAKGKKYLSAEISDTVIKESITQLKGANFQTPSFPTEREREVLQLIAEGKTIKQIASELFLSIKTIHTHRQKIMKKLNLLNDAELIKYCIREGLVPLDN